jgi:hypothetical protein
MTYKFYAILLVGVIAVSLIFFISPDLRKLVTTSVLTETTIEQTAVITIPEDAPAGEHVFSITVEDEQFGDLLAQSEPITIRVLEKNDQGEDVTTARGGSGGGGGSGGEAQSEDGSRKTYPLAPERGHELLGANTTLVDDQGRVIVRLAGGSSMLKKTVKVTRDNYWLYVTARHDQPAPVQAAIYLDGRAWKILTLDQGDDKYRMHQVGLLRDFGSGEISFKFLNDVYDQQDINNEKTDRNFWLDSWALSTDPNLSRISSPYSGAVRGTKTTGVTLLPRLNSIIREELGTQFVIWDIWSYYAPRLVAAPERRDAIGTEERLRTVMKFWRSVRPDLPRGE